MGSLSVVNSICVWSPSGCRSFRIKWGYYQRLSDGKLIRRYRCSVCKKSSSDAELSAAYRQKKRQFNPAIVELLASGNSLRRIALMKRLNRKTLAKKLIFLGEICLYLLSQSTAAGKEVKNMQFDDLESFIHTKLLPASVTLAVEKFTRRILGFRVSTIPAKGLNAKKSRMKYGPRKDKTHEARVSLFTELGPRIAHDAVIESDMNPRYPADVAACLPGREHKTYKGRAARPYGLGELKYGFKDPLFSLNHTCAMLRANINRLYRKTWCTTKKMESLNYHIAIYSIYHNWKLIDQAS